MIFVILLVIGTSLSVASMQTKDIYDKLLKEAMDIPYMDEDDVLENFIEREFVRVGLCTEEDVRRIVYGGLDACRNHHLKFFGALEDSMMEVPKSPNEYEIMSEKVGRYKRSLLPHTARDHPKIALKREPIGYPTITQGGPRPLGKDPALEAIDRARRLHELITDIMESTDANHTDQVRAMLDLSTRYSEYTWLAWLKAKSK